MSASTLIQSFWYRKSIWRWLLYPLSGLLQLLALIKRFLYRRGFLKVYEFSVPVIVVGNITVGGTGKTPFIAYLAEQLVKKNYRVGIVSRGYRSQLPNYPHLVTSEDSVTELGDEAFMQYANTSLPMAIGPDRAQAVKLLLRNHSLDLVISDDGLQHYRMGRDLEILMVDAQRKFGNQLMLPFGPLREPLSRLNSVDFIVENGATSMQRLICAQMLTEIKGLFQVCSNLPVALSNLKKNQVCAVAGIGNPQRFFNTLSQIVANFERRIFPDHHQFGLSDFSGLDDDIVIMTEKDAVKCRTFARQNWYYLKIEARLEDHQLNRLMDLINQARLKKRPNNG